MKDNFKVLITGTHSTGKSTLLDKLRESKFGSEFKFIGGVTREAFKIGLPINENGSVETQLFCASTDILNLIKNRDNKVVFDRSILDTLVYTDYLFSVGKVEQIDFDIVKNLMIKFSSKFDLVIWLRPEFSIENDEIRSTNKEFQKRIDELFSYYLSTYYFKDIEILILSGSIKDRIKSIIRILENYEIRKEG